MVCRLLANVDIQGLKSAWLISRLESNVYADSLGLQCDSSINRHAVGSGRGEVEMKTYAVSDEASVLAESYQADGLIREEMADWGIGSCFNSSSSTLRYPEVEGKPSRCCNI
jgi:hypothetical protein